MFDQCLYFNTTALARLLDKAWTAAFAELGLTPPQGFLLRLVLAGPGRVQRELAEAMTISRPTATRLLDGIEQRRLITRRAGLRDGREQRIYPTAAAEAIRGDLEVASGSVTRKLKQLLGTDAFDQTVGALREARAAISSF